MGRGREWAGLKAGDVAALKPHGLASWKEKKKKGGWRTLIDSKGRGQIQAGGGGCGGVCLGEGGALLL